METGHQDAQDMLARQMLRELSHIRMHSTRTAELLATGVVNNVLEVGVFTFDSLGSVTRSWRATAGAIEVENYGTGDVMVTSSGAGSRPNGGPGTMIVKPGVAKIVNVGSRVITLWGTVGEQIGLQAFTVGSMPRTQVNVADGGTP